MQFQKFVLEFAVLRDGSCPGKKFFEDRSPSDKAKLFVLFQRLGDTGKIENDEKFKKLADEFFEFKSHQIRMPCYFCPGHRVVVTHGFIKKKDRVDKTEIERSRRIKDEYESLRRSKR